MDRFTNTEVRQAPPVEASKLCCHGMEDGVMELLEMALLSTPQNRVFVENVHQVPITPTDPILCAVKSTMSHHMLTLF